MNKEMTLSFFLKFVGPSCNLTINPLKYHKKRMVEVKKNPIRKISVSSHEKSRNLKGIHLFEPDFRRCHFLVTRCLEPGKLLGLLQIKQEDSSGKKNSTF